MSQDACTLQKKAHLSRPKRSGFFAEKHGSTSGPIARGEFALTDFSCLTSPYFAGPFARWRGQQRHQNTSTVPVIDGLNSSMQHNLWPWPPFDCWGLWSKNAWPRQLLRSASRQLDTFTDEGAQSVWMWELVATSDWNLFTSAVTRKGEDVNTDYTTSFFTVQCSHWQDLCFDSKLVRAVKSFLGHVFRLCAGLLIMGAAGWQLYGAYGSNWKHWTVPRDVCCRPSFEVNWGLLWLQMSLEWIFAGAIKAQEHANLLWAYAEAWLIIALILWPPVQNKSNCTWSNSMFWVWIMWCHIHPYPLCIVDVCWWFVDVIWHCCLHGTQNVGSHRMS